MGFIRFPGGGEATITPNQATRGGDPHQELLLPFWAEPRQLCEVRSSDVLEGVLTHLRVQDHLAGCGGDNAGIQAATGFGWSARQRRGEGAIRSRESRHWREQPRGQAPAAGPTPQRQCQYPMDCRTALQPKRQAPGGHGLAGPSRATGWPCLSPYLWGVLPLVARERNAPRTLHCLLLGGVTRLKPNKPWKESLRFWRRFELLVGP